MTRPILVTGTDTGIGKTVFSAGLAAALGAAYWKPIQSGLEPEGDGDTVAALAGVAVLPEAYRLRLPASPHLSAREEGIRIEAARLALPEVEGRLVIEGAGGVMVPLAEDLLLADIFTAWAVPTILCARTTLGTINHSLLSVEALRARGVPLIGIVFIGDAHEENERFIAAYSGLVSLGRLPILDPLTAEGLAAAMRERIDLARIAAA
jgi:dethiobiotin synthetase